MPGPNGEAHRRLGGDGEENTCPDAGDAPGSRGDRRRDRLRPFRADGEQAGHRQGALLLPVLQQQVSCLRVRQRALCGSGGGF